MTEEIPVEVLRQTLQGLQALKENQFFQTLTIQLQKEHDKALSIIISGDFPQSETPNDQQGVLQREQLIGEVRGLERCGKLLDQLINSLVEQVKPKETVTTQQEPNENPV